MVFGDPEEPHHGAALAIAGQTEEAIGALLRRDKGVSEGEAATLARVVSAVMFLSMAASLNVAWSVEEIMERHPQAGQRTARPVVAQQSVSRSAQRRSRMGSPDPPRRTTQAGVINAGVFNSGLLARPQPRPDARFDYGTVPADLLERAARIARVCEVFGVDLPTAALAFARRHPVIAWWSGWRPRTRCAPRPPGASSGLGSPDAMTSAVTFDPIRCRRLVRNLSRVARDR